MDFIERWFGLSPDGGDGSTELLYILVLLTLLVVIVGWRYLRSPSGDGGAGKLS
jgi:hypothetical protein